ncbi:MAG TPA: isochorismatase family protein [Streptosporangiaceae bacterium]|nr:isochorismatase family protein [Streptosporangiaceae bacterium]
MRTAAVQALVLVDVQNAFVTGADAVPDAADLLAAVGLMLTQARRAGSLVIQLQNDGRPGTPDEPGQPGWALHLAPAEHEAVIRKAHDDGFRGTALAELLAERGVARIAVAGLMSEMCLAATARSALDRGLGVVLPHDAHATCDIPAVPWYGQGVPATIAARVAEWSLGDEIELVASAHSVEFTQLEQPQRPAHADRGEPRKVSFDLPGYARRSREGPCFVCAILAGHPDYSRHLVYEDDDTIAFLADPGTLLGYCLVAPKRHVESWVNDLTEAEYLALQAVVHRVARAVEATVPTERMYSLCLGSQQGNAHLHWHVAPLPPDVPYERQQFQALMAENGVLDLADASREALAREIRSHIERDGR